MKKWFISFYHYFSTISKKNQPIICIFGVATLLFFMFSSSQTDEERKNRILKADTVKHCADKYEQRF